MRPDWLRFPLYLKFLSWAALNLLLIAAALYAYAPRNESGLNLLLTDPVRDRVAAMARDLADELVGVAPSGWPLVLRRHQTIAGVVWSARLSGGPRPLRQRDRSPAVDSVRPRSDDRPNDGPTSIVGPPPFGPAPPPGLGGPAGTGPGPPADIEIARQVDAAGYRVTLFIEAARPGLPPRGYLMAADAETFFSLLRLLGINREVRFGAILLLMSALLWWPFIWQITRTVHHLSIATDKMSRGRLETRVIDTRRDELGDLAISVNCMAERLQLLLTGQRQFVADVAHEVMSPVARMQIGLGILESQLSESARAALEDIREDLEGMADMLNELLLFSRSGIEAAHAAPTAFALLPLVEQIADLEGIEPGGMVIDVPNDLYVTAPRALLNRALANLLRNANRYGSSGAEPVRICARLNERSLKIAVQDRGPGVPPSALARLGEPFFRPELSRNRETGGYGLGLAIVKRCVLGCDGDVEFSNRQGGGFEAIVVIAQ